MAEDLSDVWRACAAAGARIVQVESYWEQLWEELILPLQKHLKNPRLRQAIGQLRKLQYKVPISSSAPESVRFWGFKTMFGPTHGLSDEWVERMATAAAVLAERGEPILLLTRLVQGRNMQRHVAKGQVELDEVLRWRISVRSPKASASIHIPCVRSEMQIHRPWSARYDGRLPVLADGSRYPFCIPTHWSRRSTVGVRTVESAPAWVDAAGRAWTRPNM